MSAEYPFGYPPHEPAPGRVSVADMAELIHAGLAVPLLPEFNVCPVFYDDVWWYVPQGPGEGVKGYTLADEAQSAQWSAMFNQLAASNDVVARIQAERAAAREAGREFP